jgi:uncharacterized protein (DUF2249 family)
MTSDREPIAASWKVSEVLRAYPQLLEVFIGLSPAFAKLRNPVLRRVQTRLVTVAQAAAIAGLEPGMLVRRLNQAVGLDTAVGEPGPAPPAAASTVPDWLGTAAVAREVDARPILDRGEEPFGVITSAAREVPVGAILRLLTGFEPVPLYEALAKQGFAHWGTPTGQGDWQVDFFRERLPGNDATPVRQPVDIDWDGLAAGEVTIDVRELVPPEPMVKILAALESLSPGGNLLVHHVRRPIHLYDRLDEMGYPHATRDLGPQQVDLLIHKPAYSTDPA